MESRVPHHIPGVSSSLISPPLPPPPPLDSRVPYSRLQQHQPTIIYPIDQIKSSHVENDYIDSPAVVSQQPPPSNHKTSSAAAMSRRITWLGQNQNQSQEAFFLGGNHNHHHNHQNQQQQQQQSDSTTHPWISFSGRPSSISSSSSTSSDQRLLDHAAPTPTVDNLHHHHHHLHHQHHQHHHHGNGPSPPFCSSNNNSTVVNTRTPPGSSCFTSSESKSLDLKSAATKTSPAAGGVCSAPGQQGALVASVASVIPSSPAEKKHLLLCERCGKCRCTECTLPRTLPSCWVCNQECLCSAHSLVDAATCMCLVRGVFYHCAEDDEDDEGSCADKPCSCSRANCCARWSFMAALSLVLPCLVCYLPATGLAKLGQKCYDNVSRPGCRCKNSQIGNGVIGGGVGGGVPVCKNGGGVEAKVGTLEKQQQQQGS